MLAIWDLVAGSVVQLVAGRYAGLVVSSIRVSQPRSIAERIWNRGQDAFAVFSLTLIALRFAGVITWSWWWVLSPLWISGVLVAGAYCVVLVLLFRLNR
jgi:hypothetical protein